MLLVIVLFLHDWSDVLLLLLLLLHLLLLHVLLLLLFFNNLIHENGLVDALRCVQAWCPLAIPLDLMLITHWD